MRRQRRKPRVAWLPMLGFGGVNLGEGNIIDHNPGSRLTLSGSANDGIVWNAAPVTFDGSQSAEDAQNQGVLGQYNFTLADLVSGNSFRLRRLVGKVHAYPTQALGTTTEGTRPPVVEVGVGFIICKTDDDGTPTTDFNFVNPLTQDSAEDPWIWQRYWRLGLSPGYNIWLNTSSVAQTEDRVAYSMLGDSNGGGYPSTTAGYNSVLDGPHLDQKTARVISPSERLFVVSAMKVPKAADLMGGSSSLAYNATVVAVQVDVVLRALGSLRRSGGNRRNASR